MTLNSYSILLLKTNPNNIECLQPMLLHHKVIVANGLSEAELILQTNTLIDAVILDLSLNNIQDFEILSVISHLTQNKPTIAITENEDETALKNAIRSGAEEIIIKQNITEKTFRLTLISAFARYNRSRKANISVNNKEYEHKNHEKARWRFLSEATFEGIILHDNGTILDVNHVLAKMTGYEIEELIGKDGFKLVTPESRELMKQNILCGYEKPYKVTGIKKDGSTFPAEVQAKIISKNYLNIRVAAVRDITERNKVEKALQKRENFLRKQSEILLELASSKAFIRGDKVSSVREITRAAAIALDIEQVGVWLYNEDHSQLKNINLYNHKYKSHSESIVLQKENYPNYFATLEKGLRSIDNISETSLNEELSQIYLLIFGVTSVLNVAVWLRGRVVGMVCYGYVDDNISLSPQWSLEEETFASCVADFVTLAIEASERKAAQKALKQSEAQFKAIFEGSSMGICLIDITGKIININPALCEILKYNYCELIKQNFANYICFENGDLELYKQLTLSKIERLEIERKLIRKKGGQIWAHLSISSIIRTNSKPRFFLAIIEDISQRKITELQLRESKEAAEIANRTKSDFLATMSHELRTPLNAIMGLSQLLQQEIVGSINEKQREYVDCIYNSGVHLLELINDILDLSKVEAGKEDLSLFPLQVDNICNYVISTVRERAETKGLELTYSIDKKAEICVADERRIKQMLLNLLTNAIKFTSKGKVSLQVIKIPEKIAFRVSDTGIGIQSHEFKHLFEPFKQLDSRLNRQYEGTGLGLALTLKLARLHGGDVTVESTSGKGSRFTLLIPDDQFQEDRMMEKWESQINYVDNNTVSIQATNKRILLVEDDQHTGTLLQDYLQTIGYQVEWISNGTDFLEKVHIYKPQLILLDIQLGNFSGLDLLAALRKDSDLADKIVVVMTPGNDNDDYRSKFIQAGANDFVSKPIGIVRLESILMQYFNN